MKKAIKKWTVHVEGDGEETLLTWLNSLEVLLVPQFVELVVIEKESLEELSQRCAS